MAARERGMILLALGSNLTGPWGPPRQTVARALAEMPRHNMRVRKVSRFHETAPYGVINQPAFINAVALIDTAMSPDSLMRVLHLLERQAGRVRRKRWGPRTLDLDLLDYHGLRRPAAHMSVRPLTLPHPGIIHRRFVLEPLLEIAPHWRHPVTREAAVITLRKLWRLKQD
jgi:2-amino-4-hydroxy-6-hydroxymethyldihydropteridine diphosphokinase